MTLSLEVVVVVVVVVVFRQADYLQADYRQRAEVVVDVIALQRRLVAS
jgi:sensor domain CHASE-containing protein